MALNYNRKSAYSGSRNARTARSRAVSKNGAASNPSRRNRQQSNGAGFSSRAGSQRQTRPSARRSSTNSRLTSVRVGDLNAGGKQGVRSSRPARSGATGTSAKNFLPVIIVGTLVVVLALAVLILRSSNAFTIQNVEVTGADHLTSEEMTALMNVSEGTTLLQVDTGVIEQNLLRDAWIESVDVSVAFPHTLKIDVTERSIRAVVEVPTEDGTAVKKWAVAQDGMWLMPIPEQDSEAGQRTSQQIYEDIENVLTITDVPYSTQPEMGTYCTDDNVLNALEIVVGLTTELANQVKSVAAAEAETTIVLESGIEIVFGSSENIRDKERVALLIMEENEGTLAYINVTNPKAPTWRAL